MVLYRMLRGLAAGALTMFLGAAAAVAAAPEPWQLGFQPAATPVMREIFDFNNLLLTIILAILALVLALLVYVIVRFRAGANREPSRATHNTLLEVLWTAIPIVILVVIAIPSFKLLYYQDRAADADMTIKAVGHQWFWTYAYPDHGGFEFDALMIADEDLEPGQKRLLETDNRIVVPVNTTVRLLLTADDVIHSWTVPAFGIKTDAVPGRLNETWFRVEQEGVYYGQCSELCGVYHGFMPITVEVVSEEAFAAWLAEAQEEFAQAGSPRTVAQITADGAL